MGLGLDPGAEVSGDGEIQVDPGTFVGGLLIALLLQVAVLFINAVGWGAGIWAVTQQAAGQPATIGDALRAGHGGSARCPVGICCSC